MHPILLESEFFTIYTYGFCIAVGALLGFIFMYFQGKRQFDLTFDQSNNLFIMLVLAGIVGGKLFLIFENPAYYLTQPKKLISGSGFVFYGSLLLAIPVMLGYFKKIKVPVMGMLDVMAMVTCIVHGFGRIGCFMSGCCHGLPTDSLLAVVFTDDRCQAEPLNTPLHPTQIYEATLIFSILIVLWLYQSHKKFNGQLFLLYLVFYASGRAFLETFRGDLERGFLIENRLSNSQFISLLIIATSLFFYIRLWKKSRFTPKHL